MGGYIIQIIYGRDPGNKWGGIQALNGMDQTVIWERFMYYMRRIQVLHGRDPGIILEGTRFLTKGSRYNMEGIQLLYWS